VASAEAVLSQAAGGAANATAPDAAMQQQQQQQQTGRQQQQADEPPPPGAGGDVPRGRAAARGGLDVAAAVAAATAAAEVDAAAKIAANEAVDMIVVFKTSASDVAAQQAALEGLAAATAAPPDGADGDAAAAAAAGAPALSSRGRGRAALEREARVRAHAHVKSRVLSASGRAARRGARLAHDFDQLPAAVISVSSAAALDALKADPSVASVQPNRIVTIMDEAWRPGGASGEGPLAAGARAAAALDSLREVADSHKRKLLLTESLGIIGQQAAAAAGFTGDGCSVALLDTGASTCARFSGAWGGLWLTASLGFNVQPCQGGGGAAAFCVFAAGEAVGSPCALPSIRLNPFLCTPPFTSTPPAGADYGHADLGSCTSPGVPASCRVSYAQDFSKRGDDGARDDSGHGTNTASIVAKVGGLGGWAGWELCEGGWEARGC
jgi:hypothetical protein